MSKGKNGRKKERKRESGSRTKEEIRERIERRKREWGAKMKEE